MFTVVTSGLSSPIGISVDNSGYLYVLNRTNPDSVLKITPQPYSATILGSGFNFAHLISLDSSNNVFVADTNNNSIKKITPSGTVTTFATGLNAPRAIAIDQANNLYVTQPFAGKIDKISSSGTVSNFASTTQQPWGAVLDNTNAYLYVSFENEGVVRKFDVSTGLVISTINGFIDPLGMAVDSANNIYVVEGATGSIKKINGASEAVSTIAKGFAYPVGIAIDSNDKLYITDVPSGRVYTYSDASLGLENSKITTAVFYPNPAKDFATLSNLTKGAEVSVFDMTGKLLYQTKSTGTSLTINTSSYKNGVYMVKVDGQTTKLLISK